MARKPVRSEVRRLVAFDRETYQALHQLSLDRSASLQELADEAFRDLLRKHRRPVGLRDMLRQSARLLPSNDAPAAGKRRRT
ncbi:MAG: hypothetical protein NW223_02745 [Hyphomicrobiaceae bacterium]|nr:hypothetical protein [Hyphomicrobiaceae bacterium]